VAVRYPRGAGVGRDRPGFHELPWGKGVVRRQGQRVAILAFGTLLHPALQAAERWTPRWPTCASPSRWTPNWCSSWRAHTRPGDGGRGLRRWAAPAARWPSAWHAAGLTVPVLQLGLPDAFIEHGDPAKLLATVGLDAAGIEQSIRASASACGPALVRPAVNG
jgi:1-deoxy-D-xylulose-5-phosphate synthase